MSDIIFGYFRLKEEYKISKDKKKFSLDVVRHLNSTNSYLVKDNRLLCLNDYYEIIYKKKYDLFNFEEYKKLYQEIMNDRNLVDISILIQHTISPYIFYESNQDIQKDRKYRMKCLNYLINKICILFNDMNSLLFYFFTNFVYFHAYHGCCNVEMYEKIHDLMRKICKPFSNENFKCVPVKKRNDEKIKIAFMGNYVTTNHSVSNNNIGVLIDFIKNDKFDVNIITYQNNYEINKYLQNHTNIIKCWYDTNCTFDSFCERIKKEKYDVIIYTEIGMDPIFRFLSFKRLAPIQISTWGHSETSGINTIDYFLSSKLYEPVENKEKYSEKLILLDSLCTYYYDKTSSIFIRESYMREILHNPDKLNIPKNAKIYGCLQIYHKFHPDFLICLNKLLEKDIDSHIILLDYGELSKEFKSYVLKFIINNNKERIRFINKCPVDEYNNYLNICDVIIDNTNFGGCNSSFSAFSLGKPVIMLKSNLLFSSFTYGMYKKMEIYDFIANNEEELINIAIKTAYLDKDAKDELKNKIQEKSKKLFYDEMTLLEWKNFVAQNFK
jgi:protein O-GlcNAc transferase